MANFTFELVFTGMCLIEFDADPPTKCTVHIPNAAHPEVFFGGLSTEKRPYRHVPRLSFPTKFQVSGGDNPKRLVDRVFPASDGEEIGICDLEGDTLTLQPPAGSPPLSLLAVNTAPGVAPQVEELFSWTSDFQNLVDLSGCTYTQIDASAVTTRVRFANGQFGSLECGRQNGGIVVYDYDKVEAGSKTVVHGRSLADAVVLRLQGLDKSVTLKSTNGDLFFYPPLPVRDVVRVCISNFHDTAQPHRNGLFDFLWYYNILDVVDAQGKKPDPLSLFVPYIPETGYGPVTGSSGHCPPTKLLSPKTAVPGVADIRNKEFAVKRTSSTSSTTVEGVEVGIFSAPVEGVAASEGEFTESIALLRADDSLAGSGVLLDRDIVLTAGHVLDELPAAIVVGLSTSSGVKHAIRQGLSRRPHFDGGTLEGDLLLLRLVTPMAVAPPTRASDSEVNQATEVTVVGFGFGNTSGPEGIKRKTDPALKVLHATCPKNDPSGCFEDKELVTDESGFGGVFSRDSGAPAYVSTSAGLKLAAITSRTVPGDQGIYVRLDVYSDWIKTASAELKAIP